MTPFWPRMKGTVEQGEATGWQSGTLTADYRYLILAYSTSIQVYTTADSLLLRRIPIIPGHSDAFRIVATKLSPESTNLLWVACSDGRIWLIDWTTGSAQGEPLLTESKTVVDMTILPIRIKGHIHEVLLVSEHSITDKRNSLVTYDRAANSNKWEVNYLVSMAHSGERIHSLHLVEASNVLLAATKSTLVVGVPDSPKVTNFADMTYSFYHFETNDVITALDSRIATSLRPAQQSRRMMKEKPKTRNSKFPIVDVLVGGARGSIYFYNDLVAKLEALEGGESNKDTLVGRKYHWHRRAVHAVKWSKDGMCFLSQVVYTGH